MVIEGTPRQFATGAVRDRDENKPRPDLISPFMLMRLGTWLAIGAKRYGARNWEKGIPNSVAYESLMRHVLKFGMGKTDEDHLAAVLFNTMVIIHNQELQRADLDDMPIYNPHDPRQMELPL